MPLLKSDYYTSKDYWNQPEGERAELIDGKFYDMAPPSRIHQKISGQIYKIIANYIRFTSRTLRSLPCTICR